MHRYFAVILVVAAFAVAGAAAPVVAQQADRQGEQARTITVTGTGEMRVEPDMATVTIGVQTEEEDSGLALDGASAATSAILAILETQGIAQEDIRTGSIRLSPRYSQNALNSGTRIVGYQAVNTVEVRVLDLALLGELLSAVVGETQAGAGANRLDGVQFGLIEPGVATDEARRLAVAEGIRLATLYADAAGVSLGDVLMLSDAGSGGYRPMLARGAEMAMSSPQYDVPVAAGKIELSASVVMVFAIAP